MKIKILSLVIFIVSLSSVSLAQSPYYSGKVSIRKEAGDNSVYTYIYTRCVPHKWSTEGDTFHHDTSRVDWENLPQEYLDSMECTELSSERNDNFTFGNQMMVYENIMDIRIIRDREGESDTMRIVFPVKIKSFVTFFTLEDIIFKEGIYELTDGLEYSTEGMYLRIKLREGYDWEPVEKSSLIR